MSKYLKLSNEKLGALVRDTAEKFGDIDGFTSAMGVTGAHMIITLAAHMKSIDTTIQIESFEHSGVNYGDWEINVKKMKGRE